MIPTEKFAVIFILFGYVVLGDAASINVTISNQAVLNGSSIRLTAESDPAAGSDMVKDFACGYTEPDGTGFTGLTTYITFKSIYNVQVAAGLPSSLEARLNVTSARNPVMLDIFSISFGDEKRQFYCEFEYYFPSGAFSKLTSQKYTLENVYSPHFVNVAQSIQNSSSLTAGRTANLTCVATGRPASNITWLYNSSISATASVTYEGSPLITVTSVLTIHNPTQSMDGQEITCNVTNQFSPAISRTTVLDVNYLPINTIFTVRPEKPKLNEAIYLTCNAVGKPAVTMYSFFANGILIANSTNGNLSIVASDCVKYNGNFTCMPRNDLGTGEVQLKPVVVTDDVRTSVASGTMLLNEGQNTTLQCNVSGCPASFSVSWSRDGQPLSASGSSLELNSVGKRDAGRYSCFAQNGYTNSSSAIQVTVNYKPTGTLLSASNAKPVVNTSVTFNCTSDALPSANYRFYRIDSDGEKNVSSPASGTSGILVVSQISLAGYNVTYKCVPYNILGDGLEKKVSIDIQDPAKINQFTIEPRNTTEFQSSVSIQCTATGNPPPNVTIIGPNSVRMSQNGSVTLSNVSRSDAGLYTCSASNGIGSSASSTADLVVYHAPRIQSFSSTPSKVLNGSSATISCNADGNPPPDFRFYNENGTLLQDSSSSNYTLTLLYENYQAFRATFRCVPYNRIGEDAGQNLIVEILVLPKVSISISPSIVNENASATISCAVALANPPANITIRGPTNQRIEHVNGSAILTDLSRNDAGLYSCIASNGLSPVTVQASLTVNHEPDQVQLNASSPKPVTGSSVTLTCTARASPPPRFRFVFVNGSSIETVQDNLTNSYTISSIDYKKYTNFSATYRCFAYNSYGESASQDFTLDIQVPPSINFSVTPHTVNETQNATAVCRVIVANPAPRLAITDNNNQSISHVGGQAVIAGISRNQAGVYTCAANNGIGGVVHATSILTVNHAPDQVIVRASSQSLVDGTSLTLNCSARASPLPNRYKFTSTRGSSETILQDSSFSNHTISRIDYKNYDNYRATFACVAFNSAGNGRSKNTLVDIQVSPQLSVPASVTVIEGASITLICNVTAANPPANITWLNPANSPILHTNGVIQLSSINRNQNGVYTCQASNGIGGTVSATTTLTVNYGPNILRNNSVVEKCIGETIVIVCDASGSPAPDVSLYFGNSRLLKNSSTLRYSTQINSQSKFGEYICISNNTIGRVNFTTNVKAKASETVGNVKLFAKDNTIRVTWSLPQCSSNIDKITVQYRKIGESTWQEELKQPKPTDTEITITGLEKDAEYEVRLVVLDVGGTSHMTQGANIAKTEKGETTSNAPLIGGIIGGIVFIIIVVLVCYLFGKKRRQSSTVLPNNPLRISLRALGSNRMLVSWDAPKYCNLYDINHYDIFWKGLHGPESVKSVKAEGSSFKEEIDNLRPSAPYEFRIVTVMSDGTTGRCSLSKVERTLSEDGIGITNHGATMEKTKTIEMKEVDNAHYRGPDGSVYASVKGKTGNDVNGAIDNANFVADSDGAYDVGQVDEPPKKKEESNYASLGSFQSPNSNGKPKDKPKTEYATLEELGPLQDFDDTKKDKKEEQHTHKITVEPESNDTPGEAPGETAPVADTTASEPAADTTSPSPPPVDTSGDGRLAGSVDMI